MMVSYILVFIIGLAAAIPHHLGNGSPSVPNVHHIAPANVSLNADVECGKSTMGPPSIFISFIVGGDDAPEGGIPWQVGLYYLGRLICGGSYVLGSGNSVKVITAAHCVDGNRPQDFVVRFGMHDTRVSLGVVQAAAANIIVHEKYKPSTGENDMAIISFNGLTPEDLSDIDAGPICLVSKNYKNGEGCMVSGWGTTSEGGDMSNILQYVDKNIISYDICNTETENKGSLHPGMLCAAETGKDSCAGDSGGPLAVYRNARWELAGVVSWGFGCAHKDYPGVYSDVFYFLTWLDDNL